MENAELIDIFNKIFHFKINDMVILRVTYHLGIKKTQYFGGIYHIIERTLAQDTRGIFQQQYLCRLYRGNKTISDQLYRFVESELMLLPV